MHSAMHTHGHKGTSLFESNSAHTPAQKRTGESQFHLQIDATASQQTQPDSDWPSVCGWYISVLFSFPMSGCGYFSGRKHNNRILPFCRGRSLIYSSFILSNSGSSVQLASPPAHWALQHQMWFKVNQRQFIFCVDDSIHRLRFILHFIESMSNVSCTFHRMARVHCGAIDSTVIHLHGARVCCKNDLICGDFMYSPPRALRIVVDQST